MNAGTFRIAARVEEFMPVPGFDARGKHKQTLVIEKSGMLSLPDAFYANTYTRGLDAAR